MQAKVLRTVLPIEAKTCFPTSDGREISLGRGVVACEVTYRRVDREGSGDNWDSVLCELRVNDRTGQTFLLERLIGANWFLELVSLSRDRPRGDLFPLVDGVRCYHDHRVWIPTTGRTSADQLVTFAYWGKQLDATLDLLGYRLGAWDRLAIRVHPVACGALGNQPSPDVTVATDWAAKIIVWPTLLRGLGGPLGEQPVFVPMDEAGEPQLLVGVS